MSTLRVNNLADISGTNRFGMSLVSQTGYYIKQVVTQVDTTSRTFTGWALGPTFNPISMQANSLVKIDYHIPARNDDASWGGIYIEPQIQFNGGTWQSLGGTGYELMVNNGAEIFSYHNSLLINPGLSTDFTFALRFYFSPYGGTLYINNANRNINTTSGTATIMSGDNGNQHYTHAIIEEYARYS